MCFCAQRCLQIRFWGQCATFICFDIHVRVIGSSVLDLQDKRRHIGATDIDLRRTWRFDNMHGVMSVHERPGYGMCQRQVSIRFKELYHFVQLCRTC